MVAPNPNHIVRERSASHCVMDSLREIGSPSCRSTQRHAAQLEFEGTSDDLTVLDHEPKAITCFNSHLLILAMDLHDRILNCSISLRS